MRFLLLLLVSLRLEAMVIDPVDPAFGFAVGALSGATHAGRAEVHRVVPMPDGRVAALATIPGDGQGCLRVSLFVFDASGRVQARFDQAQMGLPACVSVAPLGLAIGAQGAFYIAGSAAYETGVTPRVWKVRADGTSDASFGSGGAAAMPGVSTFRSANIEVLGDGTVAVGGTARLSGASGATFTALVVVHLRPDGSPDASYGVGGVAHAVPPNRPIHDAPGGGMAHLADGSALVAGNIFEDDAGARIYTDAAVVRFDPRGQLDTSYGNAGFSLPLADASTYVQSLAVRNGEAYLAGVQNRDVPFAFVTKVSRTGTLDAAFATAGVAGTYDFNPSSFDPLAAVDGAGRVYLGVADRAHRKVLRFDAQGASDPTFGMEGGAYLDPSGWVYAGRGDLASDAGGAVYFGAGAGVSFDDDAPDAIVVTRLAPGGGHRDDVAGATAVIYYNAGLAHYFLTADRAEQALLDAGVTKGWQRTGQTFRVVTSATAVPELTPVCRYYGRPEAHLDSHFFSAAPDECAAVAANFGASWTLETSAAFRVHAADRSSGACPRGSERVYRAFNGRADANHYYGVTANAPAGWIYEGYGDAAVPTAFCAPLL